MDREKELLELADAYYQLEKGMSNYYRLCVEVAPEHMANWAILRKQEEEHAAVFKKIAASIKENHVRWEIGRFAASIIMTMVNELNGKMADVKSGKINRTYALTFIADFEKSLAEGSIEESFKTDVKELEVELKRLQQETRAHRDLLAEITMERR